MGAATLPRRASGEAGGLPPRRINGRLAPEEMFPAGLPGYRTRWERMPSGERIRVVETGPEDGPAVVFVGGWGCSVWDFNRTLAPVAAAGFRVLAIDPRGHGLSDMPGDEALYTTEAMVRHMSEVLDVLELPRASIVGHSMGGAIAVHLALRSPDRIAALVLISAVGLGIARPAEILRDLSPRWIIRLGRIALRRTVIALGLRFVYGPLASIDDRNVDEYWAPSQFDGFVPAMRSLLHHFRWTPFTSEELARVEAPMLSIRGGHDRIVRAPNLRPVPGPAFRELIVPEAGHLSHDEAPARVNEQIIAFLQEQRTRM